MTGTPYNAPRHCHAGNDGGQKPRHRATVLAMPLIIPDVIVMVWKGQLNGKGSNLMYYIISQHAWKPSCTTWYCCKQVQHAIIHQLQTRVPWGYLEHVHGIPWSRRQISITFYLKQQNRVAHAAGIIPTVMCVMASAVCSNNVRHINIYYEC